MASSAINQLNRSLLTNMFGRKKTKGFSFHSSFNFNSLLRWDSYSSASTTQTIQSIVKKMRAALGKTGAAGMAAVNGSSGRISIAANSGGTAPMPEPTKDEIAIGIDNAGGAEALSRWTIDGKTKLDVNGRKVVAQVGQAEAKTTEGSADVRADLAKSLSRFGIDASLIDKAPDRLRDHLRNAATQAAQKEPKLSLAIEYALEDAFAKVGAWENSVNGKTDSTASYESRRETNRDQAASISSQLNIGDGSAWGIQSIAEDLAVFGMDFSAMSGDAFDLAETIRTKSREMLDDLDTRYVGTETEYIRERNRITGAGARLINGIEGAAMVGSASISLTGEFASATATVNVGGSKLDAGFIIGVGNVIVDPLVLDLDGDGIDLSAAEDGAMFDMSGDGERNATGFIRGDDALLFLNTHGDGIVHDGRQLFGNQDGHANGFEALRQYDDNGDGVIDENDAVYDQLMVWQDKAEDGVCEEGETMTLREAGVKSINLGYENVREDDGKGNLISQNGSFTRDDGTDGYAADVWLRENRALGK